ncbi:MAG: hypothetical protein ACREIT_10740 [Tepidisphaeraceae bacterium]
MASNAFNTMRFFSGESTGAVNGSTLGGGISPFDPTGADTPANSACAGVGITAFRTGRGAGSFTRAGSGTGDAGGWVASATLSPDSSSPDDNGARTDSSPSARSLRSHNLTRFLVAPSIRAIRSFPRGIVRTRAANATTHFVTARFGAIHPRVAPLIARKRKIFGALANHHLTPA